MSKNVTMELKVFHLNIDIKLFMKSTEQLLVNSFIYLDALEHFEKTFICFQVHIPHDFIGISRIKMEQGRIILIEKDSNRKITVSHHYNLK